MIGRIIAALVLAFGAITGSQLPEFAQQYRQRLGGAVDELRAFVQRFDADAQSQGLTREAALARHAANPDELFRKRGVAMVETVERMSRLDRQLGEMMNDNSLVRLTAFASRADREIARATFSAYEPAMPVTAEGGILASIGAILAWWLYRLVTWPKRALDRRIAVWRYYRR